LLASRKRSSFFSPKSAAGACSKEGLQHLGLETHVDASVHPAIAAVVVPPFKHRRRPPIEEKKKKESFGSLPCAVVRFLLHAEVLELPGVLFVDLLREEDVATNERRPIRVLAVQVAEVTGTDLHDALVLDFLRLHDT